MWLARNTLATLYHHGPSMREDAFATSTHYMPHPPTDPTFLPFCTTSHAAPRTCSTSLPILMFRFIGSRSLGHSTSLCPQPLCSVLSLSPFREEAPRVTRHQIKCCDAIRMKPSAIEGNEILSTYGLANSVLTQSQVLLLSFVQQNQGLLVSLTISVSHNDHCLSRNIKMAPSIAETVSNTADQIHEKLAKVSVADTKDSNGAHKEDSAPAVQEPKPEPKLETNHKEPLKLSGALDHFESFDVTPTIGREFVGVNLAKWLRAPNSDELIRDLAITSWSTLLYELKTSANDSQSPNVVLFSSESKTISLMTSKRSSSNASGSSQANPLPQSSTSTPSQTLAANSAVRTTRSASYRPLKPRRSIKIDSSSFKQRRSRVERRDGTPTSRLSQFPATMLCCV
jgi:hypothetical protein